MNAKAEKFILDVRRAARLERRPSVITDSSQIDVSNVAGVLQRALLWLTPRIVAAYEPEAFRTWNEDLQADLHRAVESFRAIAVTVPPTGPATESQEQEGVRAFNDLKKAVRNIVLSEWIERGSALTSDVEQWSKELGWTTRREHKRMNELLLDDYELDQLYIFAKGHLYILDPITRFNPGGLGLYDLSIQPSFNTTSIYYDERGFWSVHLDIGHGVRSATNKPMSPGTLVHAVDYLRSLL